MVAAAPPVRCSSGTNQRPMNGWTRSTSLTSRDTTTMRARTGLVPPTTGERPPAYLRERAEAPGLRLHVVVVRVGELSLPALRVDLPEVNQPLGLGIRERREQYRLHHRVDRRARADADAERQDGDDGETRCPPQQPQHVDDGGPEVGHGLKG